MRLLNLDIRGFGRLRGRIDLDGRADAGIGLVLERNEAGKSTLAAALLAALYGLDGDRRRFRGTITDLDRHRPWNEGPYGLSLTVERGGETLTIDRDFAHDTVRVLRGAEDVTDRFRRGADVAVGEGLTGLRKEQFMASVFVGQGDIVWRDPAKLTEALQRVADSRSGTSTAAAALEALDRALERYDGVMLAGPGRVSTEIKRCETRLEEARTELDALDARRAALDGALTTLERARQDDADDAQARRRLRARRLRTEQAAIDGLLADDDALAAQIRGLRSELDGWTSVDERLRTARPRIEALRRTREHAARDQETERTAIAAAENAVEELARAVESTGLKWIPDDDDFDRLYEAAQRLKDAAREHEDFLARLDADRKALEAMGHGLPEALSLARDFESLTDADRVVLIGRTNRRTERDERRRDLESRRGHARRDLDGVAAAQDARRRNGLVVIGVALALAVAVFVFGARVPIPQLAQFALPAALAIGGLVLTVTANGHRAAAHARALATVESAAEELAALDAETAREQTEWLELAARLDMDPDAIEGRYAQWSRVESQARGAAVHRERADTWRDARSEALAKCAPFEELFGEAATEIHVDGWVDRARRARDLAKDLAHAQEALEQRRAKLQELEADALISEQQIRAALEPFDVAEADAPVADVLSAYDGLLDALRAREESREHRLPSLERQMLDPPRRAAHEERQAALRAEAEMLADVAVDEAPLGETDYERELGLLERRADARREETMRLRSETQHFLRDFETRAPALREEIDGLERAHTAAVEYEAAVTLARNTLATLGQETHRVWASALQRTATDFLRAMGSDVTEIHFDEDLGIQLRQNDRVIVGSEADRVLSAGALDAVFLAARFAVARFLGGDADPLPLVLDDPLANADDRRLLETLRLLVDAVAPEQQILLMACQHSRYEWAAEALERDGALRRLELSNDGPPAS